MELDFQFRLAMIGTLLFPEGTLNSTHYVTLHCFCNNLQLISWLFINLIV
jgi:hypothetical protein